MTHDPENPSEFNRQHTMKMGLVEAIGRLIRIHTRLSAKAATTPDAMLRERNMIESVLDQIQLALVLDCDRDGIPDSIEIFEHTSHTSCCRISDKPNQDAVNTAISSTSRFVDSETTTPTGGKKKGLLDIFRRKE